MKQLSVARTAGPAERYAAASGLAVAALFGGGNALWFFDAPGPGAPPAEIAAFYRRAAKRIVAGANMSLASIALFVLFASGLRARLARAGADDVLTAAGFGGALLGAAAGVGAETINMAGAHRARDGSLSEPLAQSLFETSQVLGFEAAGVGIGTFAAGSAAAALQTGEVLPRWLALLTLVTGVALLTPLSRLVFGPAIALLGLVSARLLREAS